MDFNIKGMSCAACSARVEKAVKELQGTDIVSVNLLTNSMHVEGAATEKEIIDAVVKAGYGAKIQKESSVENSGDDEIKQMKKKIVFFCYSACSINVYIHGTYDVGLVASGIYRT